MDTAVFLAVLGVFSTMIVGLFKLIDNQSKAQERMALSLDANTKSNQEIAEATKTGAREAKQRNGHLADLILEQGKITQAIADGATKNIVDAFQNVAEQKVEHQVVAHKEEL